MYIHSHSTGDAPPIAADEDFTRHHDVLQGLLEQQGAVYDAEEHALRVMMSEQVDAEMTHQQHAAEYIKTMKTIIIIIVVHTCTYTLYNIMCIINIIHD